MRGPAIRLATAILLTGVSALLVSCSSNGSGASSTSNTSSGSTPVTASSQNSGTPSNSAPAQGSGAVTEVHPPGDIPDTQAYITYTAPRFSLQIPEGWARSSTGNSVTFSDKYNVVTITTTKAGTAPTAASATQSELPAIRAAAHSFSGGRVSSLHRTAGTAILITYRDDSPQNPVTGKVAVEDVQRYEFYRSGTEVALTLSAPVGSDNVDPWRKITDSFAWH